MKKIFLFLIIELQCFTTGYLDNLAIKYGTDKSSKWHNYTDIYEKYFESLRYKNLKILEIGFFKGASARMWQDYFKNSELYFIDINKKLVDTYSKGLSQRCHCFVLDQSNDQDLNSFLKQTNTDFDIIIDDGGHTMQQQIKSFKKLFNNVKSGGMYIIEDLHTSYWKKKYGGSNPNSAINFLLNLVHDVNYVGAKTNCAGSSKNNNLKLNYYQKHIKSIHFYNSLCFILKK